MSGLADIIYYVEQEYSNLEKSKYWARSAQGIHEKKENLKKLVAEFEQELKRLEKVVPTEVWNGLIDAYENIQIKVRKSLKILNETTVLPEPGTTDFKQELALIKAELENSLIGIEEKIRIMEYQFPMHEAMQCIPDFYGDPEQLEAFLYQVKFFADNIPAVGHTHALLINVVTHQTTQRKNLCRAGGRLEKDVPNRS